MKFWNTLKAVLWGFLGIRSNKGYHDDQENLNVWHVVVIGIFGALIFVLTLFMLVRIITAK